MTSALSKVSGTQLAEFIRFFKWIRPARFMVRIRLRPHRKRTVAECQGRCRVKSVDDLHSDSNNINKQTALTENGEIVSGRGDAINMHDILTGSDPQGSILRPAGTPPAGTGRRAATDRPLWAITTVPASKTPGT